MNGKILLVLVIVNIIYILLGGLFFHLIEEDEENTTKTSIYFFKKQFTGNFSCVSSEELEVLIDKVLTLYTRGQRQVARLSENSTYNAWSYGNSMFFATTVVTTIGYGHISPATDGGKVFCVFYALIGIPLCLVMLAAIGDRLSNLSAKLDKKLNRGIFSPRLGEVLRSATIFIIGFALFLLIPAAAFMAMESWDYGTSVYYAIITLTTVGFGDYVAGTSGEHGIWYGMALGFWILIGLAWGATCIAAAQEVYQSGMHRPPESDEPKTEEESAVEENVSNKEPEDVEYTKL